MLRVVPDECFDIAGIDILHNAYLNLLRFANNICTGQHRNIIVFAKIGMLKADYLFYLIQYLVFI